MLQKQNILIAGATGLVGKACVHFFLKKGYGIIVLSQNKLKAKTIFKEQVAYLTWQELEEKERVYPPIDIIINLSGANIGAKAWSKDYKNQLLISRTETTERLISFTKSLTKAPKQWIQASAVGYYGYKQHEAQGEDADLGEGFLANLVYQWENTVLKAELRNTKLSILRLGVVISKKGGLLPQLIQTSKLKFITCPGEGNNFLSWIHIDDLVGITDYCIQNNTEGTINATSPFPIPMRNVCLLLKQTYKAWAIFNVNTLVLQTILGNEKANELALASQNSLPNKLLNAGYQFRNPLFENCL